MTLAQWFETLALLAYLAALASVPSILLRRQGQPTAALAWLLALFILPGLGTVAWILIGRTRLDAVRLKAEAGSNDMASSVLRTAESEVKLLVDGRNAFPAMEQAIQAAEQSIEVCFYIWRDDVTGRRFRDLLAAKARGGVVVRILVDAFGSPWFRGAFVKPLEDAGADLRLFFPHRWFRRHPVVNFVNHRKLVVVDERLAFTGGMNVGDEYANDWRDLMVQVEGPAVGAMRSIFASDWAMATGESIPCAPLQLVDQKDVRCAVVNGGPDRRMAWIHLSFFQAFVAAQRRIWIATPYFIPSESLATALGTAALGGVDVRLVVPENNNHLLALWAGRSYYPSLLQAGVRIFEYQGPMLHAKALLVDERLGSVGTANVDARSFRLSFELCLFVFDATLNEELAAWHEELQVQSQEVNADTFRQRPAGMALVEAIANLAAPLM